MSNQGLTLPTSSPGALLCCLYLQGSIRNLVEHPVGKAAQTCSLKDEHVSTVTVESESFEKGMREWISDTILRAFNMSRALFFLCIKKDTKD